MLQEVGGKLEQKTQDSFNRHFSYDFKFWRTAEKTSEDLHQRSHNNKWEELKQLIQTMKCNKIQQASDIN